MIDQGWCGVIVVEAEGTNEGLADLQARVGNSVKLFAMKAINGPRMLSQDGQNDRSVQGQGNAGEGGKSVFRLLRGQSRPGEIWLRCVRDKERIG